MEGTLTDRNVKQARLRKSTRTWRRNSGSWGPAPPVLSDGEVLVPNVKHGTNILTTYASEFPPYDEIRAEHIERGIQWMIKSSGQDLVRLWNFDTAEIVPWEPIMHPLEILTDKFERVFLTIRHIKNVIDNSPKVQKAWKYAMYWRWKHHCSMRSCEKFLPHFKRLLVSDLHTEAQRRAVASLLINFEHDGVNMQEMGRYRDHPAPWLAYKNYIQELYNISQDWESNIDNDMARKSFLVRERAELEGVPLSILEDAAAAAVQSGYRKATAKEGPWMVTLDDAMVEPILKHAQGRTFREFVYSTRARVAYLGGSGAGDNEELLTRMLELRKKYANLLGHSSWAELEFVSRMSTLPQAYGFLSRLRRESLPQARKELRELQEFANSQGASYELDHFDVDYWRQRLMESRFSLRDEYLRQFFPLPAVLNGLFGLLRTLFGVEVVPADGEARVWDRHVRFFRMREADTGKLVASFFLDAHRRRGKKRPGFWVETIHEFSPVLGDERFGPRRPAVHIVCDLATARPDGEPALLSHDEVAKLFRTTGRALRHLLSNQTEGLVAGTNGLEFDARDFPAHFLERWAFDKSTIRSMSQHVETGDPLPDPAIDAIAAARTFHSGMRVLKRTATAQIDLDLHNQFDAEGEMGASDVAKLIEAEFAVIPPRVEDHELCSLPIHDERGSGLFADLWSEALAADLLAEFEKVGLDNTEAVQQLGRRFRKLLLAPGGGRAPALAIQDFLERPPSFAAFLEHAGLEGSQGQGRDAEGQEAEDSYEDVYTEDDDYVEFEGDEYGEDPAEADKLVP